MAIIRPADIDAAVNSGRHWRGFLRRGGPALTAGVWADMSYAAGIPVANYYASTPLVSAVLAPRDGIDHGPAPAEGLTKYLYKALIIPPALLLNFLFLDVVLFYPFIDGDGGYQDLTNSVPIPRYGGEGCRIMAVSQGVGVGAVNVVVTYTNSDGVPGRQVTATLNLAANAGSLCSSTPPGQAYQYACGPFLPLATGDTGVRSIESVEPLVAGGGIHALVIVKPLGQTGGQEATVAPIEADFYRDNLVLQEFGADAYLSVLALASAGGTPATINAEIQTIWG
jgi:hypothetical protein